MTQQQEMEAAIRSEFSSHYLPEELPPQWSETFLSRDLPRRAEKSAKRLSHAVGAHRAQDLAMLLRNVAGSPKHPVVDMISDTTSIDWTTEEDWPILEALLLSIAAQL